MPIQSTPCFRAASARTSWSAVSRGRKREAIQTARMPNGMLMKKIQRQFRLSVSQPPSAGPIAGPVITPRPKTALTAACSAAEKFSKRIAWAFASRPPPARPWRTRAMIRVERLVAIPQRIEARVNPTREKRKYCFFPKRRLSQAVRGITITFAIV